MSPLRLRLLLNGELLRHTYSSRVPATGDYVLIARNHYAVNAVVYEVGPVHRSGPLEAFSFVEIHLRRMWPGEMSRFGEDAGRDHEPEQYPRGATTPSGAVDPDTDPAD